MTLVGPALSFGPSLGVAPVLAQRVNVPDAWRIVYQRLPDLPLENQYVNRRIGRVDPDHTLIRRLVDYHFYVKGRPVNYRLDWKLTLADYLDANDAISDTSYPGVDRLAQNPMDGDKAAIKRLSRKQRDALVQTLVDIFVPASRNRNTPAATPSPSGPTR